MDRRHQRGLPPSREALGCRTPIKSKTKHTVRFEHTEENIFSSLGNKEIQQTIEAKIPDEISVERGASEYLKQYGHRPHITVVIEDTACTSEERIENIHDIIVENIDSLFDCDLEIEQTIVQGV